MRLPPPAAHGFRPGRTAGQTPLLCHNSREASTEAPTPSLFLNLTGLQRVIYCQGTCRVAQGSPLG